MSDSLKMESPLVQIDTGAVTGEGIPELAELPFLTHLNLRGNPADPHFVTVVRQTLGCELPLQSNTCTSSGECKAYWLGPDEWLLITTDARRVMITGTLNRALNDQFHSLVDVSSGQTLLTVKGENTRALLSKGCPLDLHPRVFGPGQCAQTRFAKAGILIAPLQNFQGFELVVRRSFADYLLRWLQDGLRD